MAKSWLHAPGIEVVSGAKEGAYDPGQRAYVLEATGSTITVELAGSAASPVVNPSFVVSNWGDGLASVKIDGESVARGTDLRMGNPWTVATHDLVVWAKLEATSSVRFEISKK